MNRKFLDLSTELISLRTISLPYNFWSANSHDNKYCETAFEFFEKFFAILQPETERKVNIYNYYSRNSGGVMNVDALIII